MCTTKTIAARSKRDTEFGNTLFPWRDFARCDRSLRHFLVAATVVMGLSVSQQNQAQTAPDSFDVTIPTGSQNSATGTFTCSGGPPLICDAGFPGTIVDDVLLDSITFGATTYSAGTGQIIAGMAAVLTAGDGGGDVNAEWGDDDDNADGNDQPFAKAGYDIETIPGGQESTNPNVIDETILWVFRNLSLAEGVDGESQDFQIELSFDSSVADDDGALDSRPEILVFERGLNSDVSITLLLLGGTTSDPLILTSADFVDSGIDLDTVEISSPQILGVIGVDLTEFESVGNSFDASTDTVVGVRFGSAGGGADIFGVYGLSQNPGLDFDRGDAPDSYATDLSDDGEGIGPSHALDADLFLGRNPPDAENDGQPSADATADGSEETETYTFPTGSFSAGDTFAVEARIFNQTGGPARLCGWIDFNDDGTFQNTETQAGSTNAERTCVTAPADSVSTGSNPDTVTLNFVIPDDFTQSPSDGGYFARFRITSDWPDADSATPKGQVNDGEVEDYLIDTSTLPVSIASFSSFDGANGLEVSWSTVSETRNAGFYLWGDRGNGVELLTPKPIPAEPGDPLTPRSYRLQLPGVRTDQIKDLALSAVDYQGDEELYGLFQAGQAYGKQANPTPIRWDAIAAQAVSRTAQRSQSSTRGASPDVQAVDFEVSVAGMQSVSWQQLADAGLDLTGIDPGAIAVTLNGKPVPRQMLSGDAGGFRPGDSIRFWGERPTGRDALYLDRYRYRITVDQERAVQALTADEASGPEASFYMVRLFQDADNGYHFSSALQDPWYAARLRADRNNIYTTTFWIGDEMIAGKPGRLEVRLAGLTDFPADPDHHIRVAVNGQVVGERIFEGATVQTLDLALPPALLVPGVNEVTVTAPGETQAQFDISLIDTIALEYAANPGISDDRVLMQAVEGRARYTFSGLGDDARVYAWDGDNLFAVEAQNKIAYATPDVLYRAGFEPDESVPRAIEFSTLAGTADYWVSTDQQLLRPGAVASVGANALFDGPTTDPDFLVIAHPAFLPLSPGEAHPLNEFIAQREAEGWRVGLFDITELQAHYTGGMALPEAVNRFLADAETRFEYGHVLLVGGDSYDYTDNLGLGSLSFIPTHYAPTRFIEHTPADALLADLNGDGLSDKALGRWPVRSRGDLDAIVEKTLAWPEIANPQSAIWVTDSEDADSGSFVAQAERMIAPLVQAGWDEQQLDRVFFAEVAQRPGASRADSARMDLFDQLEQGRALTGFVGHGSAAMWTFQGLLTPDDLKDLYNEGNPTLIGTLTCYTSYFVSPYSDSVAHRWMNGYREGATGARIEGVPNGSVAIHGAATLSRYTQNEMYARTVLEAQLQGMTLGQAVEAGRRAARDRAMPDLVINWTLLGDPTLSLRR